MMARASAVENDLILSLLPARAGDRRLALWLILGWLALFLAAAPFAKLPLAQVPAFVPFYQSALIINDAITALLLFSQARIAGSRALLVLACGYVFTALITLAHLLTFPAVFSPTGLLGAGLQSTAWLYQFWHGGFPLVVLAYALLKGDARKRVAVNRNSILAGLLAAALAAAGFTLLATAGHDLFPALILENRLTAAQRIVITFVWALPVIVAAVLWLQRPHSVLDLWLIVVMSAWAFDIGLTGVLNAGRYDLGFYAGRLYGLLAASMVLMMLLYEQVVMYTSLLESRAREKGKTEELMIATADIAARKELSRSQEKYRTLFDSIDEGVATVEVLFDDENKAVDYVILETNQAHEKMSGMPRTFVGKRVREVMPDIEGSMIERVGHVALTGESIRFEEYVSALGRWFDIYLSRVGGEGSRTVVSLANNITERKRREHHAALLDKLSQALTLLDSPEGIVRATGEALGPYLNVSFVHVVGVELAPGDEPADARLTALAAWEREGFFVASGAYRAGDYLSEEFLRAARAGEPVVVRDTDTDFRTDREAYRAVGIRAFIAVPILKDDAWPGLISVGATELRDWRPDEITLIVEVAHRVFLLFERVRAEKALRESEVRLRESAVRTRSLQRRLMESEENERRAIHREMHDRIGQDLASAKLNIDLARNDAVSDVTGGRLEAARDLVQNAIDNSRNIMGELRPPGLDEHGLAVALELYAEDVAKRLSITVSVDGIELEQRLPRLVETTLFRITQEAISNLAKHANAREVDISLQEEAQEVRLTITDDGSGFDVTRLPEAGRYGFQIMRERAEAVDARLEIESTPGRGTRITAVLDMA